MPAGSICLVGMGWEDGLPEAITRTASSGGYSPGHLGWNSFTERSKKLKLCCLFLFISRLTLPENYLSFLLHFTCPANLQRNQLIAWFLVQSLSRVWVCDSKLCSRPGSSVSQFAQILVLWGGDVIHPSHPLSSPSPPALSLSQHQGLFQGSNPKSKSCF